MRDDGPGLAANWDLERGAGVGLSNTRERLRRLYGDSQSFRIAGAVGAGVQVDLRFPLQRAAPRAASDGGSGAAGVAPRRAARRGQGCAPVFRNSSTKWPATVSANSTVLMCIA